MPPNEPQAKAGLHPRNRHRHGYDFERLCKSYPTLSMFLKAHPDGRPTIDYAEPLAVKALNHALLIDAYHLDYWDFPEGYLCPPIPGRADYIHYIADLLSVSNNGVIPRGSSVRVLDIGTGANMVYPVIGIHEYGWSFVGTEVDAGALDSARAIAARNDSLVGRMDLRLQAHRSNILVGIVQANEMFDVTLCNPPFFGSDVEAARAGLRKFRNLGKREPERNIRNFGGTSTELWTLGGEMEFVRRWVMESRTYAQQFLWFTCLVSRKENLPAIYNAFDMVEAVQVKTIPMAQGLKASRFVAWSFLNPQQHMAWASHCFSPK